MPEQLEKAGMATALERNDKIARIELYVEFILVTFKSKMICSVSVTDALDKGFEKGAVIGQESALNIVAENIAEDAAEVFVAGKAHETAGIREHTDESGEEAACGKGVELGFDALFLIEEPPPAAELDFSGDGSVLEIADKCGGGVIVCWIQVVKNRARECAFAVEAVEIGGKRFDLPPIADGVESGVRTNRAESAGVGVSERAEVELFGPVFFRVETAKENHEVSGEGFLLRGRCSGAATDLVENRGGFVGLGENAGGFLQAVVGETTALGMEEIMASAEGFEKTVKGAGGNAGGGSEFIAPDSECGGIGGVHRLVGTEGREDVCGNGGIRRDGGVRSEIVHGIVGGAYHLDTEFF